jgi:hypothetical protein
MVLVKGKSLLVVMFASNSLVSGCANVVGLLI